MSMTYDGTNGITFPDSSQQKTAASGFGFKNRIINGAMMIDQRNAGASVTGNNDVYSVDRWVCVASVASKFTAQQSTTAPAGFSNSLAITSSSAYTVGTGENFGFRQLIEGYNIADLNWGTANAQTVTLSFWVRSSLTGTFGGSIFISTSNIVFSYTINSANTWEYKTVTIAGPTSASYALSTTNGNAGSIFWSLGAGSTLSTSAGTWIYGTAYRSVTGAVSVVGTSGATFYITGVQLEKGSTATSFDYRPYGQELALCQRYYETNCPANTAPANGLSSITSRNLMGAYSADVIAATVVMQVPKRAAPSVTFYSGSDPVGVGAGLWSYYSGSWIASTATSIGGAVPSRFDVNVTKASSFTTGYSYITEGVWAASSEL